MRQVKTLLLAILCVLGLGLGTLIVLAPGASATTPPPPNPCGLTTTVPAKYSHVIWIVFENKNRNAILSPSSPIANETPYFRLLDSQCGDVGNMHAEQHPSAGNYVAMASGGTQGITGDPDPSHSLTANNIFNQVQASGHTWREYSSREPKNCDMSNSSDKYYVAHHEPAQFFSDIYSNSLQQDCLHWAVSLNAGETGALCQSGDPTQCPDTTNGALAKALDNNALPTFVHIGPADDGGNTTLGGEVDPKIGNFFLERWIAKITQSSTYKAGGTAIFITWDEPSPSSSSISSTPIPTIVVAPSIVSGSSSGSTTFYNHYSMLRATEEMLGLSLLGKAQTANDLKSAFRW